MGGVGLYAPGDSQVTGKSLASHWQVTGKKRDAPPKPRASPPKIPTPDPVKSYYDLQQFIELSG